MAEVQLPTYKALMFPILQAVDELQGSAHKSEIDSLVIEHAGITEQELDVEYPDGGSAKGSKVLHRLAFARSALKLFEALENSERGVWSLTPQGRRYLLQGEAAVVEADQEMRRLLREKRLERSAHASQQPPADAGRIRCTSPTRACCAWAQRQSDFGGRAEGASRRVGDCRPFPLGSRGRWFKSGQPHQRKRLRCGVSVVQPVSPATLELTRVLHPVAANAVERGLWPCST